MTVKELIEALKEFPDDMLVVNQGSKTGFEDIYLPEKVIVREEPENMVEYDGYYQYSRENDMDEKEVVAIFRNTTRN